MESSRDDSLRTCAQCGGRVPTHPGGGRQADYCSRSCQAKAYRARHAHGSARDDSQWAALTARALAAEAEAASLREQLAAALHRVGELGAELETAHTPASDRQASKVLFAPALAVAPALPLRIRLGAPHRFEQVATGAWDVYVGEASIGRIHLLSGRYWPTLPNGFEVYLGGAAETLDEAADKLARAYYGWANYWHAEHEAQLALLRPQKDGARTVKWGASVIGKVNAAAAAGYGGEGTIAITPKDGTLATRGHGPTRFEDEQHAAEALLKRWHAENPPPWGPMTAD